MKNKEKELENLIQSRNKVMEKFKGQTFENGEVLTMTEVRKMLGEKGIGSLSEEIINERYLD